MIGTTCCTSWPRSSQGIGHCQHDSASRLKNEAFGYQAAVKRKRRAECSDASYTIIIQHPGKRKQSTETVSNGSDVYQVENKN